MNHRIIIKQSSSLNLIISILCGMIRISCAGFWTLLDHEDNIFGLILSTDLLQLSLCCIVMYVFKLIGIRFSVHASPSITVHVKIS